ncbi:MAG: hypothetical protein U0232_22615 [Thermomicrobiales bacterium]
MGERMATAARATAWDVVAVLELAAAEVRAAGDPVPSWDEALARVQTARARYRRKTIRLIRHGRPERMMIAVPYI